jgi:MoxR-like ATPase
MNTPQSAWDQLQRLRRELKTFLKQREEAVDGALVALLARAHLLLLGPPGTAKSLLASTLCSQIRGARYFYYWLNKFTTWRELACGEVLIQEEPHGHAKSVRFINTEGELLQAHIVVLDEVYKASGATANSLLPLLNERAYSINPGVVQQAPLLTVFAASNELPGKDQEELRAFSDRFLLRYEVDYITVSQEGETDFIDMLAGHDSPPAATLTLEELHQLQAEVARIQVDRGLLGMINAIRATLTLQHQIAPSDRRYRESVRAIKAYALLQGHPRAEVADLAILEHILWTTRDRRERETVRQVVREATREPQVAQAAELLTEAQRLHHEASSLLDDAARMVPLDDAQRAEHARCLAEAYQREQRLAEIYQHIETLLSAAASGGQTMIRTVLNEVNVLRKHLIDRRGVENPFLEVTRWTQPAQV